MAAAGLSKDPEGGRGALNMLHVIGRAHARGCRRSFEWRSGPLPEGERPIIDPERYRRLHVFLQRYHGLYLMTDVIMEECDLRDRPATLAALRVVT